MSEFRFVLASSISEKGDGLGVELVDEASGGATVAVVFREDSDNTLIFDSNTDEPLPFTLVEQLLEVAKRNLGPFEDETPLSEATNNLRLSRSSFSTGLE